MGTPRRWFAVWCPEDTDAGSMHVRATSKRSALAKVAPTHFPDCAEMGGCIECREVSMAVHAAWEQYED